MNARLTSRDVSGAAEELYGGTGADRYQRTASPPVRGPMSRDGLSGNVQRASLPQDRLGSPAGSMRHAPLRATRWNKLADARGAVYRSQGPLVRAPDTRSSVSAMPPTPRVDDRYRELATLNAIATALNGSVGLSASLGAALSLVAELLHLQAGWVGRLDEATGTRYRAAAQNL